jgi:plastin-1
MHIVGIQGADIVDGSRTLTLGLVWQLMRMNIVKTLASLSKGGKEVTDSDIVRWANETVKKGGKTSTMKSFKDGNNKNAIFFLDLLDSLKPGYVDYSLVNQGRTDEECRLNGGCNFFSVRSVSLINHIYDLYMLFCSHYSHDKQPNWPSLLQESWAA